MHSVFGKINYGGLKHNSLYLGGLYYKHNTIINYASSGVNKLRASLNDDARVVIYNCHMFIVQATGGWQSLIVYFFYSVRGYPDAVHSSGISYFCFVFSGPFPDGNLAPELSGLLRLSEVPDPHVPHAVFGAQDFQEEVLNENAKRWTETTFMQLG